MILSYDTQSMNNSRKIGKSNVIKIKNFVLQWTPSKEWEGHPWNGRKYSQSINLIRDLNPEYILNAYNSIIKRKIIHLIKAKGSEWTFLQVRGTNSQQEHGKILTSLVIRETQLKTIIKYHFAPTPMAIIKERNNNKYFQGSRGIRTFIYCWWEWK